MDTALWADAALLVAALPTAATVFVLAEGYDRHAVIVSTAVVLSTALSLLTFSAIVAGRGLG